MRLDYYVLSDLETELMELFRVHRVMRGGALKALYPPENDYHGSENRGLAIALAHLVRLRMLVHDPAADIYRATVLDEVSGRRLRVMDFFLALHADPEEARGMLLLAGTKGPADLSCPTREGVFEYLLYADTRARAVRTAALARRLSDESKKNRGSRMVVIGLRMEELKLCRTHGIPAALYLFADSTLRRVRFDQDDDEAADGELPDA